MYNPCFPKKNGSKAMQAGPEEYVLFRRRLGLARSVAVAPSSYWNDNRALVNALDQAGGAIMRGVAIVDPDVSDQELDNLHAHHVRGMRVYLGKERIPSIDELKDFGRRCADRGWHILIVGDREAEVIVPWETELAALPCPVVFDHFGFAPHPPGAASATAGVIKRLLDTGRAYVKLSGVYIPSKLGFPTYADVNEMGIDLVNHAPERVFWGSDWPHPTSGSNKPDGAYLLEQLSIWAPDEAIRKMILVDNPTRFYFAD